MRKLLFCLLLLSSTVFSDTNDAKVDKILRDNPARLYGL